MPKGRLSFNLHYTLVKHVLGWDHLQEMKLKHGAAGDSAMSVHPAREATMATALSSSLSFIIL